MTQLKFIKMPINGKVMLGNNVKVIGCKDQNTLVCLLPNWKEESVPRFFATMTDGAKIDGLFDYIGPVPNSDLYLFELRGGATVTR